LRAVIAEKLFEALAELLAPSVHHAAAINTIGCYLLCHLTGEDYEIVAGSIVVRQGGVFLVLQADASRIDEHEYYLWIERRHADARVERVDFAARCWMDWAREQHALWLGSTPGPIWMFVDELDDQTARYTLDGEITHIVRVALHNAFRSPDPPEPVAQWESVINKTVDLLAHDPRSHDYLVERGIVDRAEPSTN
jgi:hypothetical protein